MTPNEAETLHLLLVVVVPRVMAFLAVAIGPWAAWAIIERTKNSNLK